MCKKEELCQIYLADNILAYKFSGQQHFIVICIYQNPKINVHAFIDTLDHVLSKFKQLKLVIIGNFNENIYLKTSSAMLSYFASVGCQQKIKRPTTDSGTLIDHLYTQHINVENISVEDCYFSHHDKILFSIKT